jgi:hypothetical protein
MAGLDLDLQSVVELYYPLVHPDIVEMTINPETGLHTVRNTFVNLAILPDFKFMLVCSDVCRAKQQGVE